MKIYIVFDMTEREVLGIYSSFELAEECRKRVYQDFRKNIFIETYTLDKDYV